MQRWRLDAHQALGQQAAHDPVSVDPARGDRGRSVVPHCRGAAGRDGDDLSQWRRRGRGHRRRNEDRAGDRPLARGAARELAAPSHERRHRRNRCLEPGADSPGGGDPRRHLRLARSCRSERHLHRSRHRLGEMGGQCTPRRLHRDARLRVVGDERRDAWDLLDNPGTDRPGRRRGIPMRAVGQLRHPGQFQCPVSAGDEFHSSVLQRLPGRPESTAHQETSRRQPQRHPNRVPASGRSRAGTRQPVRGHRGPIPDHQGQWQRHHDLRRYRGWV